MPLKTTENKPLTIPEVKEILEKLNRELSPFQRKTLDYAMTFSKLDAEDAKKLTGKLVNLGLDIREVVQIVNCMPETIEELRVFFPKHKDIETEKLQEIIKILNEYRK